MPGMRVSMATSLERMAAIMESGDMPLMMVMASFGPIPLTEISRSNSCLSFKCRKP